MQRTWIGIICACLLLCSAVQGRAAEDVSADAQKRMSIIISELTRLGVYSVQAKLLDPKNPEALLDFAARYVESTYPLSKSRLAPALLKSGGTAPLGERLVSLQAVKDVVKRFFAYDLPSIAPGQYGSIHFDGKDFHIRMAGGARVYWAQVKEAKELATGNIQVQGVLRTPEDTEIPYSFTAELKPILWKSLKTYAVVSLTTTPIGE